MSSLGNSKLTRRFQVTIPKSVRRILRLDTGDLLVFVKRNREILVKRGRVKVEE